MTKETSGSSVAAEYLAHGVEVMRANESFVRQQAEGTYEEVIHLINDAIDEVGLALKRPEREKYYLERTMSFFTQHVLMPFSYAIYWDLLAGNLPACFMELRLMLESLVKCYLADSKHPEVPSFQTRLDLLEQEMGQEKLSTSKVMKKLGGQLEAPGAFVALWGKLSEHWSHMKGFTDKLVSHVTEKSDMPPWALGIPLHYAESDLSFLEELRERISQFRSLLTITMEQYRREYGSDIG